jgi:two-component system, sensor histidine kinase
LKVALQGSSSVPDLLLTDHRLPDGDGVQAIGLLQARHGLVPVLVLTGDTAQAVAAAYAGPNMAVLHKPVQPEDLLQHLLHRLRAG